MSAEHWSDSIPSVEDVFGSESSPAAESTVTPAGARTLPLGGGSGVTLEDFYSHMPTHSYVFMPNRDLWPAVSVNARIPAIPVKRSDGTPSLDDKGNPRYQTASAWLDRYRAVEQMTWTPGEPPLIRNRLVADGGWIDRSGCACINLYRPPQIKAGDAREAERWLEHIATIYPEDCDHIVTWLAHRVQRPHEKINHALVLGGLQGIGKDTLLEPVKDAVGPWNFAEVSPTHLLGRFNSFLKSVILRINEARDLGEIDRFSFYDHLKAYTAAPPDVLRVDEKNLREYVVWNVCGVVITTNHKTDGLYLPADDRRHYVAWSTLTQDDFKADYWPALWEWYAAGGTRHVAAYLATVDLSTFNAKAPPRKTEAFWDIVNASRAPEDAELADLLDKLEQPMATTLAKLADTAAVDFRDWLRDRKNSRKIPHRLEAVGYVAVRNPAARDGLWAVEKRRTVIYAKQELSLRDRLKAAQARADSAFE
jgi:Family of unknown function (DUF5906)